MSFPLDSFFGIGGQIIANQQNKKLANEQRDWNEMMWQRQANRDDQLWNRQNAYNLQMWKLQNQYNSPLEQMARFKEAGLNPHLIYSKGSAGIAGDIASASPQSHSVMGYNKANVDNIMRGFNVFGQHAQFKNLNAQTNNLELQGEVLKQTKLNQSIDGLQKALNLKKDAWKWDNTDKPLLQFSVDAAALGVKQQTQDLEKGSQSILKLKQELNLLKQEERINFQKMTQNELNILGMQTANAIKNLEYQDYQIGIRPNDPMYARLIARAMNDPEKVIDALEKAGNNKYGNQIRSFVKKLQESSPYNPYNTRKITYTWDPKTKKFVKSKSK